jgi:hypothetical protein
MTNETQEVNGSIDTGGVTLNDRDWILNAIQNAGGTVTDTGMGCGSADFGYTHNGKQFSVNVTVRQELKQAA